MRYMIYKQEIYDGYYGISSRVNFNVPFSPDMLDNIAPGDTKLQLDADDAEALVENWGKLSPGMGFFERYHSDDGDLCTPDVEWTEEDKLDVRQHLHDIILGKRSDYVLSSLIAHYGGIQMVYYKVSDQQLYFNVYFEADRMDTNYLAIGVTAPPDSNGYCSHYCVGFIQEYSGTVQTVIEERTSASVMRVLELNLRDEKYDYFSEDNTYAVVHEYQGI